MKLLKLYKEDWPAVKLIGLRYTDKDRDASGSFATHWQEFFGEGYHDALSKLKPLPGISDDLVGAMRMSDDGGFEYWIGGLFAPDADVSGIFESADIPPRSLGVCWLYGSQTSGELYAPEAFHMSMDAFGQQGWNVSETDWFFERYNCPRYTTPDDSGNVILDICATLV